eukprot:TRINITY_DN294_c1_g1_i2.p1 TRINITY_DN294_c1_g1~~TRINITY_DN294_c1_g1_i2.p1  ORF type:complete len:239 (-),score=72.78 TRINITY_DN294_c1_g1_i2:109-825(-)
MKAIAFFAILLVAANCASGPEVLFYHFNQTYQKVVDVIESYQNKNYTKAVEDSVSTIISLPILIQDYRDILPLIVEQYDNLGYETKPCYDNIKSIYNNSKELINKIKRGRGQGVVEDGIAILTAIREANETCRRIENVTRRVVEESIKTSPVCNQTIEAVMKEVFDSINLPYIQRLRQEPNFYVWRHRILVACGRPKNQKRVSLNEQTNQKNPSRVKRLISEVKNFTQRRIIRSRPRQ